VESCAPRPSHQGHQHCNLTPHMHNQHQVNVVAKTAGFLGILAPPYDSDHDQECHCYWVLDPLRPKEASRSTCDLP
jgi:hypothetical protein